TGELKLTLIAGADPGFPMGMNGRTYGVSGERRYVILIFREHGSWPEDVFIGALLRELAHVVARRPPESEWPEARKERALFKEGIEYRADAMVWRWELSTYSLSHLNATYPPHRVDAILPKIAEALSTPDPEWEA
ncbi:MAG: hypothetical protein V2B18_25030, partial [Pseudomonadota bacterium]